MPDLLRWLRRLCGYVRPLSAMPKQAWWQKGFVLHQPTSEALRLVFSLYRDVLVCRVDIALDLITESRVDADAVKDYFDKHQVQRWRGHQKLGRSKETTYSGVASCRNNVVHYSDRPSKVDGRSCCHLEWRISSAVAVRAAELGGLDALLDLDHRRFWARRLQLLSMPETFDEMERLGKAIHGQSKRRKPWLSHWSARGKVFTINRFVRLANANLRISNTGTRSERIGTTAQEALDKLGPGFRGHFPKLDHQWVLPVLGGQRVSGPRVLTPSTYIPRAQNPWLNSNKQ